MPGPLLTQPHEVVIPIVHVRRSLWVCPESHSWGVQSDSENLHSLQPSSSSPGSECSGLFPWYFALNKDVPHLRTFSSDKQREPKTKELCSGVSRIQAPQAGRASSQSVDPADWPHSRPGVSQESMDSAALRGPRYITSALGSLTVRRAVVKDDGVRGVCGHTCRQQVFAKMNRKQGKG